MGRWDGHRRSIGYDGWEDLCFNVCSCSLRGKLSSLSFFLGLSFPFIVTGQAINTLHHPYHQFEHSIYYFTPLFRPSIRHSKPSQSTLSLRYLEEVYISSPSEHLARHSVSLFLLSPVFSSFSFYVPRLYMFP
jgi:hypothetical protein